jgi:hypothetical protein
MVVFFGFVEAFTGWIGGFHAKLVVGWAWDWERVGFVLSLFHARKEHKVGDSQFTLNPDPHDAAWRSFLPGKGNFAARCAAKDCALSLGTDGE